MTLPSNDLIFIAAIAGSHGVRGECKVKSFAGDPAAAFSYGPFMDETGKVILTPMRHRAAKGVWVVSFKENLNREEAHALKGTKLYIPRSALPELEEEEFYHSDLIGMTLQALDGSAMGQIKGVHDFGAGDILEITDTPGRKGGWFLPFTLAFFPHVDLKAGVVTIDPPEDIGSKAEEAGEDQG